MTVAPLMHGAAQWAAFISLCGGRPFVMPQMATRFDPAAAWAMAARERVMSLSIVGDAFGRPLLDELESGDYDLSALSVLISGGAALSAGVKQRFVDLLPQLTILDAGGSSESGSQMVQVSSRVLPASGRFDAIPGAVVVSEDLTRILTPGNTCPAGRDTAGHPPLTICGTGDLSLSRLPIAPDRGCGDSWSAACLVRSGVGEGLAGQPNFPDARTLLGEYPLCYS